MSLKEESGSDASSAHNENDQPCPVADAADLNDTALNDTDLDSADANQANAPSLIPSVLGTPSDASNSSTPSDLASDEGSVDSKKQKVKTQDAAQTAYDRWSATIPSLVDPLLRYQRATYRGAIPNIPDTLCCCRSGPTCAFSHVTVRCLLQSDYRDVKVAICSCRTLPQILVEYGLFPTAPHQPRMAVGIEVLELFRALFERSSEATQALAHALNTYYARRGFYLYNSDDESTIEPFRKGLGYAIQWFDMLLVEVERQKEDAILRALDVITLKSTQDNPMATTTPPPNPPRSPGDGKPSPPVPQTSPTSTSHSSNGLSPGQCARFLQELCPLCFGGVLFGRPVEDGGDIHVSVDGNFNHRHTRAAGDCPEFHRPRHVISKEEVDRRGDHIEKARAAGKKKTSRRRAPDAAIDACEEAHEAGSGSKIKTNLDKFDHGGVMGMICRHDRPLFLANIDTPGEQQKFGVALIEHLFQYLPPQATVMVAYDVGCVIDRSRELYNIFTEGVSERLGFVTTAMHAYAHQWACQVVYAPRMRKGMGLTDGEGIERLWGRIRRLIPITRNASARRRLWLLDRAMTAIGNDTMPGMAAALSRKLKNAKKRLESVRNPNKKKFSSEFIRQQWCLQQAAQMSVQSQAPIRIKKELDSVLTLQAEIDSTRKTLESTRKALGSTDDAASAAASILDQLDKQQQDLANRAEELYASVNVAEAFPGLHGLQLNLVRGLLMARDMKISIRKRAIGSFFEWDRLKQASGGRTKLHQKARANIQKRAPALTSAIHRFNKKIEQLKSLYQAEWKIPLPEKLPTDLGKLKDDPSLLTDVWTSTSAGEEVPPWLSDPEVRDAIASMHAEDRCSEERIRVGIEADNMIRWFRKEFLATEVALRLETSTPIAFAILRYRNYLRVLTSRWRGDLVPGHVLKFWEDDSAATATRLVEGKPHDETQSIVFLEPVVPESLPIPCESDDDLPNEFEGDGWNCEVSTNDVLMDDFLWDGAEEPDEEEPPSAAQAWTTEDSGSGSTLKRGSRDDVEVSDLQQAKMTPLDESIRDRILPAAYLNDKTLHYWRPVDIATLRDPTARLNDVCMNSGAALIKSLLSASPATSRPASSCCIFSTFDLLTVRDGTLSDAVWRRTRVLEYWAKSVWILPIHRTHPYEHWVLACIQLRTGRIYLFDSLAETSHWLQDIQDIATFIANLATIAAFHGKVFTDPIPLDIPWDFRNLVSAPMQTTSYSCGLWVLASIGAILSACHTTELLEEDMNTLHSTLLSRVRLLPVSGGM
ncbi:hypothetical protein BKA70DRAFT_1104358 [Coprinopsis sp. MPI-PUGE-AT-0042]|nr:hypothetical protein BKA70DRAFT_1104358 [Coprinopsis sp. MPI-PUGE-AT-0042]